MMVVQEAVVGEQCSQDELAVEAVLKILLVVARVQERLGVVVAAAVAEQPKWDAMTGVLLQGEEMAQ